MDEISQIELELKDATAPSHRGRLLARGLARGLIWKEGIVPHDGPEFHEDLTEHLIEYGLSLLHLGLRLKKEKGFNEEIGQTFLSAGESLESAFRRGNPSDKRRGFYIVSAATAYHLARYAARSFCMVSESAERLNLSILETAICLLLKRQMYDFRDFLAANSKDPAKQDSYLAEQIESAEDPQSKIEEVIQQIIECGAMSALCDFEFALKSGDAHSVKNALQKLSEVVQLAKDVSNITLWWQCSLLESLVRELWPQTLYEALPAADLDPGWRALRRLFISSLYMRKTAEIDLWPSQIEAAKRSFNIEDDLVVTLPTSAGKTRIAEICILRALSMKKRVIYVTPLRALSAQTEQTLSTTFRSLNFSVSNLYGASGSTNLDQDSLSNRDIVISTPEKLDFAIRNDPNLLDDVGLIVLDEGHMIGHGEREIRYEILVQRLLRRADSQLRRIVCLSAILPKGKELEKFVGWVRSDAKGTAIQSSWKPNRQRFGAIIWQGSHARMQLIDRERAYIARFLEAVPPTKPRRTSFPNNKNELVLASAWAQAQEGKRVLIYCPQRRSVETLARCALKANSQGFIESLVEDKSRLREALNIGLEWLGENHIAIECLRLGIAIHHARLPRPFLAAIEELISQKICKVIIASPTLAQGLNLAASTLIIHSLYRDGTTVPKSEFANVIGRAGRAFVDLDGLILFPIMEKTERASLWQEKFWEEFHRTLEDKSLTSGLLQLVFAIASEIERKTGEDQNSILEYVLDSSVNWKFPVPADLDGLEAKDLEDLKEKWETNLSMLDTSCLSLIEDLDLDVSLLAKNLDEFLAGSLWARQVETYIANKSELFERILQERCIYVWKKTTPAQRKGFFAAGVGLKTGKGISGAENLGKTLHEAEELLGREFFAESIERITKIATVIFSVEPFVPNDFCVQWQEVLSGWILGLPMSNLILIGGVNTVDFIQDAIVYKLVWALESIRVIHSVLAEDIVEESHAGLVSAAVESGSLNISALILLQSGLSSRTAAHLAVSSVKAQFKNRKEMWQWLFSDQIAKLSETGEWPSRESFAEWQKFYYGRRREFSEVLVEKRLRFNVEWRKSTEIPSSGILCRLTQRNGLGIICRSDFKEIGTVVDWIPMADTANMWAEVISNTNIDVLYLGPKYGIEKFEFDWSK